MIHNMIRFSSRIKLRIYKSNMKISMDGSMSRISFSVHSISLAPLISLNHSIHSQKIQERHHIQ